MKRISRMAVALFASLALIATGCSTGDDTLTLTADFDDVLDLVVRSSVRAGDIVVGQVTAIELTDDNRARVTMTVTESNELPRDVIARVARTSLLGERFIDIVPDGTTGELSDGMHLENTIVANGLEELVAGGGDLLALASADKLAIAVQTGAEAFGGRGSLLGTLIENVNGFVGDLDADKEQLLRVIDNLDDATARLAPNAEGNAAALEDLRLAAEALAAEDDRLIDTLADLTRLAVIGETIMVEQADVTDRTIRRLRKILSQLTRIDGALNNLLVWLPRHNELVPNGAVDKQAQVWLDFIVCGLTETNGDPTRDCTPPNGGESNSPPAFVDEDDPCLNDVEQCERRQDKIEEGS